MADFSKYVAADDEVVAELQRVLKRRRKYKVEALADELDLSPKRIRDGLAKLREAGFRIPEEVDGEVELHRVAPSRDDTTVHQLPLRLLEGDRVRFGVVSDTHLGSKECALSELHLAYDWFAQEEIDTVLHGGDLVAGVGVFKAQHNELTHHTFEDQRDHAIADYPKREGVTTKIIGGNHDLEGDFGKVGADPVKGVANQRDDFDYLGPFSAWLELANGAYVHLLHGKGGGSYALSYKMQKRCEAYPAGRKPASLIFGHFHSQLNMQARGIQGMFPGCFEWGSSQFSERLGLQPAVGFHIVECRLAEDGSVVRWRPEWFPLWEGRIV